MGGKLDGKKKLILIAVLVAVIVIGIVLIAADKPPASEGSSAVSSVWMDALFSDYDDEPAYSSGFYTGTGSGGFSQNTSYSSECFWCDDTGKCPECHGLKDCQYKYGASHPCVNGKIYYGGKTIPCSACDGSGDCNKCDGTGRCPYCR